MYLASLAFGFRKQNMMYIAGHKNCKVAALSVLVFKSIFYLAVWKRRVRVKRGSRGQQRTPWRIALVLGGGFCSFYSTATKLSPFTVKLHNAYLEGFLGSG